MKRSIGIKVFSMLAVMALVFIIAVLANISALGKIGSINNTITDTYIKIEMYKGSVSTAFQQVQLYANLSYIKGNTDDSDIIQSKLEQL